MNAGSFSYALNPGAYDYTNSVDGDITSNGSNGIVAGSGKQNGNWNASPNGSGDGSAAPKAGKPSPLACLACRQKHLKCDGRQPVCGRCTTGQLACEYTASRRGYKGPSKKRRADPSPMEQQLTADPQLFALDGRKPEISPEWHIPGLVGAMPLGLAAVTPPDLAGVGMAPATEASQPTKARSPLTPESASIALGGDGYLVDVYYSNFHNSHPILPPLRMFYDYSGPPPYLEQVVKFIGAHFTPAASPETYRQSVVLMVSDQAPCAEKVQALLLLTIVLHSRNERQEAGALLAQAMDLAYELGMHRRSFAEVMAEEDPIRQESFRRTWWELFVIEGMLTALGVRPIFTASNVPLEVPLPCEERIYQEGLCPPASPPTLAQFDDRVFADEDFDFSSYSYRIEAVRILGRVVLLSDSATANHEMVESVDARIASWSHHIPESKMELIRADGTIDEMMFQARMIINGASIYLHFPRSDLLSSPAVAAEVICGHSGICLMPAFSHHDHAMKAVTAASEISTLAALRMPVTRHTPFFICALVLSSIVQLAAYSVKAHQMPDPRRDRLTLTVGVFKSLGRTWAISYSVMRQIKAVARDVLDIGMRPTVEQNSLDFTAFLEGSQYWLPNPQVVYTA
jgi:Fungal specific transcription factor domain/Fungal Zn(2)-Cys(6) binuclear cluster domain